MSVWLQSLGQFFWVFVINEANSMECYKVMGETVEAGALRLLLPHTEASLPCVCASPTEAIRMPGLLLRLRRQARPHADEHDQHMEHPKRTVLQGQLFLLGRLRCL